MCTVVYDSFSVITQLCSDFGGIKVKLAQLCLCAFFRLTQTDSIPECHTCTNLTYLSNLAFNLTSRTLT